MRIGSTSARTLKVAYINDAIIFENPFQDEINLLHISPFLALTAELIGPFSLSSFKSYFLCCSSLFFFFETPCHTVAV